MRSIHQLAAFAVLAIIGVSACASAGAGAGGGGGGNAAAQTSETFPFAGVKSVFVETPVEVRLRTGAGGDMRSLETSVAEALREHLRQDLGWTSARTQAEADVTARFQLTDWDNGAEGTRVGGTMTLLSPTNEKVFSATSVYPSRYGTGAIGPQTENLPNLFRSLLKPVKDRR